MKDIRCILGFHKTPDTISPSGKQTSCARCKDDFIIDDTPYIILEANNSRGAVIRNIVMIIAILTIIAAASLILQTKMLYGI